MKIAALMCNVRLWLAIMLSITLGLVAAAEEIHPASAAEIACMASGPAAVHEINPGDAEKNDGDQQPTHRHHTHSCGPCHLHVIGTNGPTFSYATSASLSIRRGANPNIPRAAPQGLYRPPRA